jgi:hypothetical protein
MKMKMNKIEFANKIIEMIKKASLDEYPIYDIKNNHIQCCGVDHDLNHYYEDLIELAKEDRQLYIANCFQSIREKSLDIREISFDEARAYVLPITQEKMYFEGHRLIVEGVIRQDYPEDYEEYQASCIFPVDEMNCYLATGLVISLNHKVCILSAPRLNDWGVTFSEVYKLAMKNLEEISSESFIEKSPGLWVSPWRDDFDPSRMLLIHKISALNVQGDPVAFIPNGGTLIIADSHDEYALNMAIDMVFSVYQGDYSTISRAYILKNGGWKPFSVNEEHSAYRNLLLLNRTVIKDEYNRQRELLEPLYSEEKDFVPQVTLINPEDRLPFNLSIWLVGFDVLLPKVDRISISDGLDINFDEASFISTTVDFDQLLEICGHRLKKMDVFPERYLCDSFPSLEERIALGFVLPTDPELKKLVIMDDAARMNAGKVQD